jgi:hypothetical protein
MQRRYPALEDSSSTEATLYREAYNELGRLRKFEFFKDPVWPLQIAEMLASREGWKRADLAAATPAATKGVGSQTEESAPSAPLVQAGGSSEKALPGEELALDGPGAPPPADTHTQEVKRAMIEARKRYPAIGTEGTDENRAYVEVYEEGRGGALLVARHVGAGQRRERAAHGGPVAGDGGLDEVAATEADAAIGEFVGEAVGEVGHVALRRPLVE